MQKHVLAGRNTQQNSVLFKSHLDLVSELRIVSLSFDTTKKQFANWQKLKVYFLFQDSSDEDDEDKEKESSRLKK